MTYDVRSTKTTKITVWRLFILAIAVCAMPASHGHADDVMTFQSLSGKWTGFGWFHFGIDQKERGRCVAVISSKTEDSQSKIDLTCKSEVLGIDATAYQIVQTGADLKGAWTMRSHEVDGSLVGKMSNDTFSAKMIPAGQEPDGFGADLTTKLKNKCNATINIKVNSPIDLKKIEANIRRC